MKAPALAILLVTLSAPAGAQVTMSGLYDELLLVVRGDQVTGAFTTTRRGNGTDDVPQFSCAFLLRGRLADGKADIATWTPGDHYRIPGQLALMNGSATLRLQQDQDGCAMAAGDMVHADTTFTRSRPGADWIGVALVKARRTVLHPAPMADGRRVPRLVAFDAVAVLARRGGWALVRYFGNDKPVTGWLPGSDLFTEHTRSSLLANRRRRGALPPRPPPDPRSGRPT